MTATARGWVCRKETAKRVPALDLGLRGATSLVWMCQTCRYIESTATAGALKCAATSSKSNSKSMLRERV